MDKLGLLERTSLVFGVFITLSTGLILVAKSWISYFLMVGIVLLRPMLHLLIFLLATKICLQFLNDALSKDWGIKPVLTSASPKELAIGVLLLCWLLGLGLAWYAYGSLFDGSAR